MGIEAGDASALEASASCDPRGVLGVLADLDSDPLVLVVDPPHDTLVLETGASCLSRGMDTPLARRCELPDSAELDEGGKSLFEDRSCREGPYGGPLSF